MTTMRYLTIVSAFFAACIVAPWAVVAQDTVPTPDVAAARAALNEAQAAIDRARAALDATAPTPTPTPDPEPVPEPDPAPLPPPPVPVESTVTAGTGWPVPPTASADAGAPVLHVLTPPGRAIPNAGLVVDLAAASSSGVALEVAVEGSPWAPVPTTTVRGLTRGSIRVLPGARSGAVSIVARATTPTGLTRATAAVPLWAGAVAAVALPAGDVTVGALDALARQASTPGRLVTLTAAAAGTRVVGAGTITTPLVEIDGASLDLGAGTGALVSGRATLVLSRCSVTGDPTTTATLASATTSVYLYDCSISRTRFGVPQYTRVAERIVVDGVREDSIKNPWCVVDVTIRNSGVGGGGAHPDMMQAQELSIADVAENRLIAGLRATENNAGQGLFFKRIAWSGAIVDCEINNCGPGNPAGVSCVIQAVQCAWRDVWIAHSTFTGRSILRDDAGFVASGVLVEACTFTAADGKPWNGGRFQSHGVVPGVTYK